MPVSAAAPPPLENSAERKDKELREARAELAALQADFQKITVQKDTAQAASTQKDKAIARLQSENSSDSGRIITLEAEIRKKSSNVESCQVEIRHLQGENLRKESQISTLQSEVRQKSSEIDRVQRDSSRQKESDISRKDMEIRGLQSDVRQKSGDIDRLRMEVRQKEMEISTLRMNSRRY